MSSVYAGPEGLLDLNRLILSDTSATGVCLVEPGLNSETWLSKGSAYDLAIVQDNLSLQEAQSNFVIFAFNIPSAITMSLPSSFNGLTYHFRTDSISLMRVLPQSTDRIRYSGGLMALGEYLELQNSSSLSLIYLDGIWVVQNEFGSFIEETP